MTALEFEAKIQGTWRRISTQRHGMPPGTISDNREDGRRDVYVTQVFEDHATISRLPFGVDIEEGSYRIINQEEVEMAEVIARLGIGERHEMTLKPGRAPEAMLIRYRCVSVP